jgi:hypothetical protein
MERHIIYPLKKKPSTPPKPTRKLDEMPGQTMHEKTEHHTGFVLQCDARSSDTLRSAVAEALEAVEQ